MPFAREVSTSGAQPLRAGKQCRLDGVGLGGDGVATVVRSGPDEDAGFGLGQRPPVGLLPVMMPAAQRRQIALAGSPAFVVGKGVVQVGADGGPPAAGEGAPPLPGPDQGLEPGPGLVPPFLAEVAAGPAFQP